MPKAGKTHSGAAKRFKVTKKGKVRHSKTCKRHLLTNKGRTTKTLPYGSELSSKKESKKMKQLMPSCR